MSRVRVLVTAAGTAGAAAVISELRKYPDYYEIIGADINPAREVASSLETDQFYVFPSVADNPKAYFRFLKDFVARERVSYIFCFIDEEVVSLSRHRGELLMEGAVPCIANSEAVELCHYKDRFSDWVERYFPQAAIRRFFNWAEVREKDFPVFVKPVEGRASIGCHIVRSRLEIPGPCENEYLIQEYLEGDVFAVDVVRNRLTGQYGMLARQELLRNKNGCGIAVRTALVPELEELCRAMAEKMDLHGVINMEFFRTEKGFRIIEANPRLSAGTAYSCMSGFNTVMNALYIARGEPCQLGSPETGKYFARRYETYEMG